MIRSLETQPQFQIQIRVRATRWLAMTLRHRKHTSAFSRRDAPEACRKFPPLEGEGVGNAGCPVHPQPRARILVVSMRTSIHSEVTGIIRHSRTQWFTAYTALSPVIGLLTPSWAEKLRPFDASAEASGPHDFAVRQ
jgi:hypothetical protein